MKNTFSETKAAVMHFTSRLLLVVSLLLAWATVPGANNAMAGSIIFSDDFTGPSLDPAWQVQPGQGSYSLVGGNLRYYNQGPRSGPGGWFTTSLTLALPFTGTHWEIDTKATYNLYWLNSLGNSSGAQRPQVMLSFDSVSPYNDYADFDRGVDAYYGDNHLSAWYINQQGQTSALGLLNPADAAIINNIADGTYWYRIVRDGGTLTMAYSYDGVNYNTAFSAPLANPSSSYNQLLLSATTWETVGSFTDYDYVTISSAVPEPGSLILFGSALLTLAFLRLATARRARLRQPSP